MNPENQTGVTEEEAKVEIEAMIFLTYPEIVFPEQKKNLTPVVGRT